MLKIRGRDGTPSQLNRALKHEEQIGNYRDNDTGKPTLPGIRAAKILEAQTEPIGIIEVNVTQDPQTGAWSLLIESRNAI